MSQFAGEGGMELKGKQCKMYEYTLTHEPKHEHGLGASSPFWGVFVVVEGRMGERERESMNEEMQVAE